MAAINIQRGRDHGIPAYTSWREPCGLSPIRDWIDLEKVVGIDTARRIQQGYRSVDDIDLFVAGLAERPVIGGLVGPTFACIIAQQFSNLRKGDRFWYENDGFESSFTPAQLQSIRQVSLAQLICRSLGGGTIQPHIFLPHDLAGNERRPCGTGSLRQIDLKPWLERDPFHTKQETPSLLLPVANDVRGPSQSQALLSAAVPPFPIVEHKILDKVSFVPNGEFGIQQRPSSLQSTTTRPVNSKLDFKTKRPKRRQTDRKKQAATTTTTTTTTKPTVKRKDTKTQTSTTTRPRRRPTKRKQVKHKRDINSTSTDSMAKDVKLKQTVVVRPSGDNRDDYEIEINIRPNKNKNKHKTSTYRPSSNYKEPIYSPSRPRPIVTHGFETTRRPAPTNDYYRPSSRPDYYDPTTTDYQYDFYPTTTTDRYSFRPGDYHDQRPQPDRWTTFTPEYYERPYSTSPSTTPYYYRPTEPNYQSLDPTWDHAKRPNYRPQQPPTKDTLSKLDFDQSNEPAASAPFNSFGPNIWSNYPNTERPSRPGDSPFSSVVDVHQSVGGAQVIYIDERPLSYLGPTTRRSNAEPTTGRPFLYRVTDDMTIDSTTTPRYQNYLPGVLLNNFATSFSKLFAGTTTTTSTTTNSPAEDQFFRVQHKEMEDETRELPIDSTTITTTTDMTQTHTLQMLRNNDDDLIELTDFVTSTDLPTSDIKATEPTGDIDQTRTDISDVEDSTILFDIDGYLRPEHMQLHLNSTRKSRNETNDIELDANVDDYVLPTLTKLQNTIPCSVEIDDLETDETLTGHLVDASQLRQSPPPQLTNAPVRCPFFGVNVGEEARDNKKADIFFAPFEVLTKPER